MHITTSKRKNGTRALLAGIALAVAALQSISLPAFAAGDHGFVNKRYAIEGGWEIVQENGQTLIRFDENFRTQSGPDLKVFLSPLSIADVSGSTATVNAINLGELQSANGSQDYVLPSGVSLNDFNSVLVHCEQYSVLWGGGSLHGQ